MNNFAFVRYSIMKNFMLLLLSLVLVSVAACGGGGSSSGDQITTPPPPPAPAPPPPPSGGIGRTGIAIGPISTFGSIVVNGVTYDTDSASFTVNEAPGTQTDLSVGDIVAIVGTVDEDGTTGTADEVLYDEAVTGPVDSIDVAATALVVLGQNVQVTLDTSFDDGFSPASLEGVSVGQIVEVSGQFDADGNIGATRIEPKPAGTQFEVHGSVTALDTAAQVFNLGNLTIDYSSAMLDDFPNGQINDGDPVEAKGTMLGAGGELIATRVEFESLFPDIAEDDFAEIEGFITRFVDATDFDVAGLPVTTDSQTVFEGGSAADLGLNIKVEAEGVFDANGVIVAEKVDIRRAKAVRAQALIDSVDIATNSVVVLGITVTTDELTRFEDKSSADVDPMTIADVNAGDFVEVRGDEFPAGSGTILATIFERDDPDPESRLQGFVENDRRSHLHDSWCHDRDQRIDGVPGRKRCRPIEHGLFQPTGCERSRRGNRCRNDGHDHRRNRSGIRTGTLTTT